MQIMTREGRNFLSPTEFTSLMISGGLMIFQVSWQNEWTDYINMIEYFNCEFYNVLL